MILTINAKGEVEDFEQERIFQGSDDYNILNLYAPFQNIVTFRIAFRLPDNTILGDVVPIQLTYESYDVETGLGYWTLSLSKDYTEQWGYTNFSIYGQFPGNSTILATPIIQYYVEESIDMTPFV